jgi:hypothetical protein
VACGPLPAPRDATDWLACTLEEGQTFDEYVAYVSQSGRMPTVRANDASSVNGKSTICLLPIVDAGEEDQ